MSDRKPRFETQHLLVHGFIRQERNKYSILATPVVILELIFKFTYIMRFYYDCSNEIFVKISQNAQNAKFLPGSSVVRFGCFLSTKYPVRFRTLIHVHYDCKPVYCGIGFLTPAFTQFKHNSYGTLVDAYGENHSTCISLNGIFKAGKDFTFHNNISSNTVVNNDMYAASYKVVKHISNLYQWCKAGEIIAVEINMFLKLAWIWNYSKKASFEKNRNVFKVGVPDEVAILIYGGCQYRQTFSIQNQQFFA